jgi:hypothetical protein
MFCNVGALSRTSCDLSTRRGGLFDSLSIGEGQGEGPEIDPE